MTYTLRLVVRSTNDPGIDEITLAAHTQGGGATGLELATRRFPSDQDRRIAFAELLARVVERID